mmetsp:Transcript_22253/g.76350  ORF Transcript_22253/g.76350 Transcript_22253/m.76350 type:complete len:422 (-) Transcript_22253:41-1306(-)
MAWTSRYESVDPGAGRLGAWSGKVRTYRCCWLAALALGFATVAVLALRPRLQTKGQVLFFDDFDELDSSKWFVERSLDDGGNGEFQAYTDDPSIVFARKSRLVIQPRPMTADAWYHLADYRAELQRAKTADEKASLKGLRHALEQPGAVPFALNSGRVNLAVAECTASESERCGLEGDWDDPIPPIVSAMVSTKHSFAFTYGTLETRIRVPVGDWVWPAVWLLPVGDKYSGWPMSGEIDLMEARGNGPNFEVKGSDQSGLAGNDRLAGTIHCADAAGLDDYALANTTTLGLEDDEGFLVIGLEKRPGFVQTYARERDGSKRQLAVYPAQPGSDPKTSPTCANAAYHGSPDAPYDQEYYLIINVAVGGSLGGGVLYWGSEAPWRNCSHDKGCDPKTLFQQQQAQWLPTWTRPFEIDWVRVTK